MNKSIVFGALIIGVSVVASPFIFDYIKQAERKEKFEKMAIQKEISDVIAVANAANIYKERTDRCPQSASELVGVTIKREPKDRLGLAYKTNGDCIFKSFKGISSSDY